MRILVIEDEIKIANSIKKGLEQENYHVKIANSGLDGYELAQEEDFDVIILDLMLPEMDGLEICEKLRIKRIHTPILMLTAKAEMEDKVKGLDSGADDYLAKPFAFEELLARIRAITRRPQQRIDEELKCEQLVLNLKQYKVTRENREIILSKKEFSLLEYLMRNQKKIVTKDQIVNNVWDYDSDVLPNTIEQYIKYLRNKIDKPFSNLPALIHTVRGFGYVLKCEDKNVK